MTEALDSLVELLDLEVLGSNRFQGSGPDDGLQRVFGGQVAGQALVAAGRTVERGRVHSLHAYFLRPGDPSVPILYEVDRIRDGRSFTTRRVVAVQHGEAIFTLAASFHGDEAGFEHHSSPPGAPGPETLPSLRERREPYREVLGRWYDRPQPIDVRHVGSHVLERRPGEPLPPRQQVWIRADGTLPDDPLLHACVVAYASDFTLVDTTTLPHGVRALVDHHVMMASLDHAMWFHRPFRADEWLLYDQVSPVAVGGLAYARGEIFTRTGQLVVSVAQEALLRPIG